ncbi:Zn-finger in Ran binding protein [Babesia bovis T2Bo]|uniref:RanBP2-type domain-containing protein n=1 Tax=Babesia bovis TaxID=5865 RepID=A7AX59_BABBO|nr:Zn-finger in Ran binding protein [Babesia bovis T2Bo]EDO05132.1 Zn-finger in Ran binding protein [Babesia bovis T2Bo]|eukprot:XP_001608700.1 hypothetical protein [Babesia bovis T2Bo]
MFMRHRGEWICAIITCGNVNTGKSDSCSRCGIARFDESRKDSNGGRKRNFHDWHCDHCGNANWARRKQCNICQHARPSESLVCSSRVSGGV